MVTPFLIIMTTETPFRMELLLSWNQQGGLQVLENPKTCSTREGQHQNACMRLRHYEVSFENRPARVKKKVYPNEKRRN